MNSSFRILRLGFYVVWAHVLALSACLPACGQAPGVPVYQQGRKASQQDEKISTAAQQLHKDGKSATLEDVKEQLKRTSCQVELPKVSTTKLGSRELCQKARRSHLRLGWCYLCGQCDRWHVNLAGGYVIANNGAVATCYHVVQPGREVKEGTLIAADDDGQVFPVLEVLAASRYADAAIVRVEAGSLEPLALSTNVYPGDLAYCFSDPLDHRGYFSDGIVNRFYQVPGRRPFSAPASAAYAPTRLNVSTDWAPGSSGSAVLDDCGNAIGHVSTISAIEEEGEITDADTPPIPGPTMIVFHEAVSAKDVLRLVK